jgi:hypothetical protein
VTTTPPQPMTAALIFRRQLVRRSPFDLQQALSASKLPLEKFHRLLDLAFWVKFLKFDSISCFVFLWDVYRVSLDPVILSGACGAPMTRPGGRATLSCPPGPRLAITKFWYCIHCLQLSYSVLHRYNKLEPELPSQRLIHSLESLKSPVVEYG